MVYMHTYIYGLLHIYIQTNVKIGGLGSISPTTYFTILTVDVPYPSQNRSVAWKDKSVTADLPRQTANLHSVTTIMVILFLFAFYWSFSPGLIFLPWNQISLDRGIRYKMRSLTFFLFGSYTLLFSSVYIQFC